MEIGYWPNHLIPRQVMWALEARTRSAGRAINGFEQIVGPPSDHWVGELTFPAGDERNVKAWRTMSALLAGRHNAVWMPVFDYYALSLEEAYGAAWSGLDEDGVPFSDGALFSDGVGYSYPDITLPVTQAAAQHDPHVYLDLQAFQSELSPGVYVNIGGFLHVIKGVHHLNTTIYRVGVRPNLRADVAAGGLVSFTPRALVRFDEDDTGKRALDYGRWGPVTIKVREVLNRNGLSV